MNENLRGLVRDIVERVPEQVELLGHTVTRKEIVGFSLILGFIGFCAMLGHLAIKFQVRGYAQDHAKAIDRLYRKPRRAK